MAAKPYNGHPSWNAWNVSLWIGNDESLYRLAIECLDAVPEIVELRDTETGNIFDIAVANRGTAQMRAAR